MRKSWSLFVVVGALAAAFIFAGSAKADGDKEKKESAKVEAKAEAKAEAKGDEKKEAAEFLVFDKSKMGTVKFPHKVHAETAGNCDTCHGGKEPLFAQKKTEGMKMADMYAGKECGFCHDGKKKQGEKVIFAAKGGCMKCHKKEAAKK